MDGRRKLGHGAGIAFLLVCLVVAQFHASAHLHSGWFAAAGKRVGKKDLGLIAMSYGSVYVAKVAMGAKDEHTLKAFLEAEAYDGPSLIIAYSHCIAHGINMTTGMQNQKAAVESGQWLLYRYHPDRVMTGENPFQLDSRRPKIPVEEYMYKENRFKMLTQSKPKDAKEFLKQAQQDRFEIYLFDQALDHFVIPFRIALHGMRDMGQPSRTRSLDAFKDAGRLMRLVFLVK